MPVFRKDGKNILFIHVPKCGGTSIEHAFRASGYQSLYLDGRMGPGSANYLRPCTPQHMHADLLDRLFLIDRFDGVFMTVRDPIARFRSEYVWRNRERKISTTPDDVAAWAEAAFTRYDHNPYMYDNHLRPQAEFWMPQAVVYRIEDGLPAAIHDLNERFGLDVTDARPPARQSINVGVASSDIPLTDATRDRIADFYADDYVRFDYDRVAREDA